MKASEPITEEWLREVGFTWHSVERSPRHWLLWMGALTGRPFESFEDLGVELSADVSGVNWFCWLRADYSGRYSRFIHVRQLRDRDELIRLIEALTDQEWNPANHLYGSIRRVSEAIYIRKEQERADLKWMREGHPWREIEKDDSRGRPLPEHQEKAEFGKDE